MFHIPFCNNLIQSFDFISNVEIGGISVRICKGNEGGSYN